MKVLMCSPEMFPFAKTGGLADVVGALPLWLKRHGAEVIIAMPKYRLIDKKFKLTRVSPLFYSAAIEGIKVYFVDNDAYYNRSGLYGDKSGDYSDNLERFSFYCRQALALIKEINFKPDIIHCHEWQSALIPVYLKAHLSNDPFYGGIKTLFTIHNLAYQGVFSEDEFDKLYLKESFFNLDTLEFYGNINLLKGAIVFSDCLNTVSPSYAKEILTAEYGCGLEGVLGERKSALYGILNGIDYNSWDPQGDKFIFKRYSKGRLLDKYVNKYRLQKELGLSAGDTLLFGMVSRLAGQKGIDLLIDSAKEMLKYNIQLVILGAGEEKYRRPLKELERRYPDNLSVNIKFDECLAHKIYAASDVFLVPSSYEPCGLGQMIALRYAALPLVFKTGGLADTVSRDNGFVFEKYNKEGLLGAVRRAIALYRDKGKWLKLTGRAFDYNFSWDDSAKKYIALYKKCMSR